MARMEFNRMADVQNVVEVFDPSLSGRHMAGTGYHLGAGLILTADHVLSEATHVTASLRFLGSREVVEARVAWRSADRSLDVALLQASESFPDRRGTEWGQLIPDGPSVGCDVVGFRSQRTERGNLRDTEHVVGSINPGTGLKSGLLAVSVPQAPVSRSGNGSGWSGMSGAPVHCGELLVGIVVQVSPDYSGHRLLAVPVAALLADRQFVDLLTAKFGRPPASHVVNPKVGGTDAATNVPSTAVALGAFDVFLSYNNRDMKIARQIDRVLSSAGLRVFFAERLLGSDGDAAGRLIEDGLGGAQSFALVIGDGEDGPWVRRELDVAVRFSRERGVRLVPIYAGSRSAPPALADRPAVDLRGIDDEAEMARLLMPVFAPPPLSPDGEATTEGGEAASSDVGGDGIEGHGGIGIWGYRDQPAVQDLLRRHAIIEALAGMLWPREQPVQVPARDGKSAGAEVAESDRENLGPSVVALEGPWGTGKTTMMSHVERRLRELTGTTTSSGQPDTPGGRGASGTASATPPRRLRAWRADLALSGWFRARKVWDGSKRPTEGTTDQLLTAWFEPWSYQTGEQVWAGLARSLLSAAEPVIGWNENARERYWFYRNIQRLDVRELQRSLRRRLLSPLLRVAVFALVVPIIAQLARATNTTYTLGNLKFAGVNVALLVPTLLLLVGLLHTVGRLFRPAATLLPTELFTQPVLSGALGNAGAQKTDPALRDPYYRASSGYLYLLQHDVFDVLCDIEKSGYHLVVFVDDLDRCTAKTTAEVFEAINMFLTQPFPTTRFVIGLDATAVVAHLDRVYDVLAENKDVRRSSDPSTGWSYLRKLIQLQVPMPVVPGNLMPSVLDTLLGISIPTHSDPDPRHNTNADTTTRANNVGTGSEDAGDGRTSEGSGPDDEGGADKGAIPPVPPKVLRALETNDEVRQYLSERLAALPELSIREAKRLLTTWQFLVHVMEQLEPETGRAAVDRAKHLVTLAEILSRWPAAQRALLRRHNGASGLALLARAPRDDISWARCLHMVGLDGEQRKACTDALRDLLCEHDGELVAEFAARLT